MVGRVQVARGDDDVGIHVVGIFVCFALYHCAVPPYTVSGLAMCPAMALAAATAGLVRYTSLAV